MDVTPGTAYMLGNKTHHVHTKEEFSVSVMLCSCNTNLHPPSHIQP